MFSSSPVPDKADAVAQRGGQLVAMRAELAAAQATIRGERQQNAELVRQAAESAPRLSLAETGRDARESAARLQGQIDAMTAQHAELMLAITGGTAKRPRLARCRRRRADKPP